MILECSDRAKMRSFSSSSQPNYLYSYIFFLQPKIWLF